MVSQGGLRPSKAEKANLGASRMGRKALAALGCFVAVATVAVLQDAKRAKPWFDAHNIEFHFKGEGPSGFRVSFAGDTRGSINPNFSAVSPPLARLVSSPA